MCEATKTRPFPIMQYLNPAPLCLISINLNVIYDNLFIPFSINKELKDTFHVFSCLCTTALSFNNLIICLPVFIHFIISSGFYV